jgi:GDP-4-dehydro-6-deoxy-D-mannose reductase
VRVLVTGGNGFAGRHLVAALRARGDDVVSVGRTLDGLDVDFPLDLSDPQSIRGVIELARPGLIFHLAAIAFIPDAINDPIGTYEVNVLGTAHLFEAVRDVFHDDPPRFVYVSSAEVYGERTPGEYPLHEGLVPRPATPYAASKLAGEAVALAACQTYGIPALITRAFNHVGPGQSERFAVPAFAKGLARIANGAPPVLMVGNLEAKRDFLDVRDVVAAYIALARDGAAGEIYNVCSGRSVSMTEILRQLITAAHVAVEIREDPELRRPSDNPLSVGDNSKLRAATGWQPRFSLAQTLRDVYAEARDRLAAVS